MNPFRAPFPVRVRQIAFAMRVLASYLDEMAAITEKYESVIHNMRAGVGRVGPVVDKRDVS